MLLTGDSLKGATREKWDVDTRKRIVFFASVSKNWKEFLQADEYKTELFVSLSQGAVCRPHVVSHTTNNQSQN